MRTRSLLALTAALLATLALAPNRAAAQPTRWIMASAYAEGAYHTRNIRAFLEDIERTTGGRLTVQLHPTATLLPMPQIKRGVQQGQVQLGEILLNVYGNEDPFFEVDGVPFLADTWPATEALHRATLPLIRARLERQGLTLLYMVPWASQAFYTRSELRSIEDLRGQRFRAYNALTTRMAELIGATPVTVQAAEVAQAFATNVISVMFLTRLGRSWVSSSELCSAQHAFRNAVVLRPPKPDQSPPPRPASTPAPGTMRGCSPMSAACARGT